MERLDIQKYQMLQRVGDFANRHANLFPAHTAAGEIIAAIVSSLGSLSDLLSAQVSGNATIRTSLSARSAARKVLRTHLESLDRTARALKIDTLRLTGSRTDQACINAGRAFAVDARPLQEQLLRQGLPPEFLDNLDTAVRNFEGAILTHAPVRANRSAVIRAFDKALGEALDQLQKLETIVSNTMADNPAVMAAWNIARRIERYGGSRAVPAVPEPTPTASIP